MNKRGLKITIDNGHKGCGKTYLTEKLYDFLKGLGEDVIMVNDPLSSMVGINECLNLHDVTIIEKEIIVKGENK